MAEIQQFCTFYLDNLFLGVDVRKVQEVLRYQEMTRVPLASSVIRGLINLRGQIVTAVDLRQRLELGAPATAVLPMNVILRRDDGAVSLLVDEIGDVLETTEESLEAAPDTVPPALRQLIRGVYKLKHDLLLVLDTDKVMNLEMAVDAVA